MRDPLTNQPFPNNVIPTARLDPVALNFTSDYLPLPNLAGNRYSYNVSLALHR